MLPNFQRTVVDVLAERRHWEYAGDNAFGLADADVKISHAVARELESNEYASHSSIARSLGVSESHVAAACSGGVQSWELSGVISLRGEIAARYVTKQGAHIVRSISGFEASDTVLRAGLDPRLFEVNGHLSPPNMLWQLNTGEWVAVDNVSVGYGGGGVSLAHTALTAAGVSERDAETIVGYRFCDAVDMSSPATWETSRIWPVEGRTWPQLDEDDLVIPIVSKHVVPERFHGVRPASEPDPDPTGFYPSSQEQPGWKPWVDFLDGADLPDWARGQRTATLFFSHESAADWGYEIDLDVLYPEGFNPSLVIRQGSVELWVITPRLGESGRLVHDDCFTCLRYAGFDADSLERADIRRGAMWFRALRVLIPDLPLPETKKLVRLRS